jgi:hypothetical protein
MKEEMKQVLQWWNPLLGWLRSHRKAVNRKMTETEWWWWLLQRQGSQVQSLYRPPDTSIQFNRLSASGTYVKETLEVH